MLFRVAISIKVRVGALGGTGGDTAASRKVAGQFPMGSLGCSINPSCRTVALGSTPTLTGLTAGG